MVIGFLFALFLTEGNYMYATYEKPWEQRKPPFNTKPQIWNCPRASLNSTACIRTDFAKRPDKASVAWKNSKKREKFCQLYQAACVTQRLGPKYDDCMQQTGDMYLNTPMELEEIKLQSDSLDCRLSYLRFESFLLFILFSNPRDKITPL